MRCELGHWSAALLAVAVPVLLPASAECVRIGPESTPADYLARADLVAEGEVTALRVERQWFDLRSPDAMPDRPFTVYRKLDLGYRERVVYTIALRRVWKEPRGSAVVVTLYGEWDAHVTPFAWPTPFFFLAWREKDGSLHIYDNPDCSSLWPQDSKAFGAPTRNIPVTDWPDVKALLQERIRAAGTSEPAPTPEVDRSVP